MQNQEYIPNIQIQTSKGSSTNLVTGLFYSLHHHNTSDLVVSPKDKERLITQKNLAENKDLSLFAITEETSEIFKDLYPYYNFFHKSKYGYVNYEPLSYNKENDFAVIRNWKQYKPNGEYRNSTLFRFVTTETKNNVFSIFHKECHKFLKIENNQIIMKDDVPKDFFEFLPVRYKIKAFIENFKYPQKIENLSQIANKNTSSFTWNYVNEEDLPYITNLPINQTNEKSYIWSFDKTPETEFLNSNKTKINALYYGFDGEQKYIQFTPENLLFDSPYPLIIKDSQEKQFKIDNKIIVPEQTKVESTVSWSSLDVKMPFQATARIEIHADRLKVKGEVGEMAKLDVQGVLSILNLKGMKGDTYITDQNEVMMRITGTIKIKGVFDGKIEKKEFKLNTSNT